MLSRVESPEWYRSLLKDRIAPLVQKNVKLRLSGNKFVHNSNFDEPIPNDESLDAILTPEFCNSIFDSLNTARSQLAEKRSAKSSQQDFYSMTGEQDKDQSIESPIGSPTTLLGSKPNAQIQSSQIRMLEQGQDIEVSSDHQQSTRASSLTAGLSSQRIVEAGSDALLVDTQRKKMLIPLNSATFNRASNLPTPLSHPVPHLPWNIVGVLTRDHHLMMRGPPGQAEPCDVLVRHRLDSEDLLRRRGPEARDPPDNGIPVIRTIVVKFRPLALTTWECIEKSLLLSHQNGL